MDVQKFLSSVNRVLDDSGERLQRFLMRYAFVQELREVDSEVDLQRVNATQAFYFRVEFDSWDQFLQMEELLFRFQKKFLVLCREAALFMIGNKVYSKQQVLDVSNFIELVALDPQLRYEVLVPLDEKSVDLEKD